MNCDFNLVLSIARLFARHVRNSAWWTVDSMFEGFAPSCFPVPPKEDLAKLPPGFHMVLRVLVVHYAVGHLKSAPSRAGHSRRWRLLQLSLSA
jgi:hypothetical protein